MVDEKEKYKYLVAALPSEITRKVYNIIIEEPADKPFTAIMKRTEELEPTDSEQIKKLLKGMHRGNSKPSSFLREMRSLAKGRVDEFIVRKLWLSQLPPITGGILEMSKGSLDELAEAADKGCVREEKEKAAVTTVDGKEAAVSGSEDHVTTKMIEALEKWAQKETRSRRGTYYHTSNNC